MSEAHGTVKTLMSGSTKNLNMISRAIKHANGELEREHFAVKISNDWSRYRGLQKKFDVILDQYLVIFRLVKIFMKLMLQVGKGIENLAKDDLNSAINNNLMALYYEIYNIDFNHLSPDDTAKVGGVAKFCSSSENDCANLFRTIRNNHKNFWDSTVSLPPGGKPPFDAIDGFFQVIEGKITEETKGVKKVESSKKKPPLIKGGFSPKYTPTYSLRSPSLKSIPDDPKRYELIYW